MYLAQLGKMLPGSPDDIFSAGNPGWKAAVDAWQLTDVGRFTNNNFAQIEIFHFIGLFLIAASVILVSLRLMGLGIKEEPVSVVEKNTRWFLHIGAIMAIGTGLLMAVGNGGKLYGSPIFTAKMIAMIAGLIFSYAVMIPVAKREGQASTGAKVGAAMGLLLALLAWLIFAVRETANVGWLHMIWAGILILCVALQGKMRWVYLVGLAVLIIAWQVSTHFVPDWTEAKNHDKYMLVNRAFMYATGIWVFGLSVLNIFGRAAVPGSTSFARMTAYVTIIVWVTVGAGGRWIGLS